MPQINQLNTLDNPNDSDLLPIYSQQNGDARKVSVGNLRKAIESGNAQTEGFVTQYSFPAGNGFTTLVVSSKENIWLILRPTAPFNAGTIKLPPQSDLFDGQRFIVNTTEEILNLTLDGNGANLSGQPVTIAKDGSFELRYDAGSNIWYRVSGTASSALAVTYQPAGAGAVATTVQAQLRGENTTAPAVRGFYENDASGVNVHRLRDRVFIGDAVTNTARSAAPYGGTWLSDEVATWPEKNSRVSILSQERIAALVGIQATNAGGASAIGFAAFSHNKRTGGTARAMYADVSHETGAQTSFGLEVAINNRGTNEPANSYSLLGGAIGIHMTPEGGSSYTLGDADAPAMEATAPATVGINISAGSGGTANKRWNLGIRFGYNALTFDESNNAVAMSMGPGHTIEWMASSSIHGARIRSKVTAVAGQDVGILFENNLVSVKGAAMATTVAEFSSVSPAVNNIRLTNSVTGNFPTLSAVGSDTDIGLYIDAKGTGNIRLRTGSGAREALRISDTANTVNFLNVTAAATGNPPRIDALGADANIDIYIGPKGTGKVRFGTWESNLDAAINGYITVKDLSGVVRKLATIA